MISDAEHAAVLRDLIAEWGLHSADDDSMMLMPNEHYAIQRAIEVLSRSTKHFVEVTGNAWAIEHPLPCRDLGSLLLCPLHTAVEKDFKAHRGWPAGRYFVMLDPFGDLWIERQT